MYHNPISIKNFLLSIFVEQCCSAMAMTSTRRGDSNWNLSRENPMLQKTGLGHKLTLTSGDSQIIEERTKNSPQMPTFAPLLGIEPGSPT